MLNLSKGIKLEVYKIKASLLTFPNLENTSGTMSCDHFFPWHHTEAQSSGSIS